MRPIVRASWGVRWLLLFALAGCGRYNFGQPDASADTLNGDARGDAAAWPTGPFNAPQLVAALSQPGHDDDPTATGDGLEMYYQTDIGGAAVGYADIWMATRASTNDPWGTPSAAAVFNSTDEDQAPGITTDGLTMYFTSRRPGGPGGSMNSNIWVSTRASRTDAWSTPVVDINLSTTYDDFEPQPDASHTHLVFYTYITATEKDLYESTRPNTSSPWSTPVPITELNTSGAERSPFLSPDGLTIYFSSDRNSGSAGVNDMFYATRTSTTQPFGTPVAMTEINTANDDDDPWLSSDGRILMMTSDRSGDYEIYEARR